MYIQINCLQYVTPKQEVSAACVYFEKEFHACSIFSFLLTSVKLFTKCYKLFEKSKRWRREKTDQNEP